MHTGSNMPIPRGVSPSQMASFTAGDLVLFAEAVPRLNENAFLIDGILPKEGLSLLFGPSGCGKSFLALEMAACISSGDPFLSCRTQAVPVLYVGGEGSREGLTRRVYAIRQRYENAGRRHDLRAGFVHGWFDLTNDIKGTVRRLAAAADTMLQVFHEAPGLVIIDTLAAVSSGEDENSPQGMGRILRGFRAIMTDLQCPLLVVHHPSQAGKRARGHTSLYAACEAVIHAENKTLAVQKQKEGADSVTLGYGLRKFGIAPGMTTCTVVTQEVKEKSAEEKLSAHLRVLEALRRNPDATQRELAQALGLSAKRVNHTLQELAEAGLLSKVKGRYVFPRGETTETAVETAVAAETAGNSPETPPSGA